jgi:hypothetical protein
VRGLLGGKGPEVEGLLAVDAAEVPAVERDEAVGLLGSGVGHVDVLVEDRHDAIAVLEQMGQRLKAESCRQSVVSA